MAGSAVSPSSSGGGERSRRKEGLGWVEWGRGWWSIVGEFLFQRISASHLERTLPLPPLDGRTCIVTGCTSGIGLEIARQLAESGAHVVMAVRKTKLAHELIQKWQSDKSGMGLPLNVEVMELDLLSLDSVVQFAEAWNARLGPLHVLINNAGIFSIGEPQRFSKDGYEEHMQVNHLAPALLSTLLIPSLIRGSPSRIINVNSIMHSVGFVDTEDMNMTSGRRKFSSLLGYTNSKLAQVKFSSILHKQIPAEAGINVVCVSPGIVHTNVARDLPKIVVAAYHLIPYFIFDAQEGSRSSVFAATDPQVPEYCGLLKSDEWPVCSYISHDCRPTNASEEAHNLETSQKVWEKTLDMVGLPPDAVEKLIQGEEALLSCPTGSIHTEKPTKEILEVQKTFPLLIDEKRLPGVYHCGYHSDRSYGATSYLIVHPEGNILVDSPRYTEVLARNIEKLGGACYMFLTHIDDVGDHEKWSKRLRCERILHSEDVEVSTADVEMQLYGVGPWDIGTDFELIHTPGHTEGSVCLYYKPLKVLFTGDHLAKSHESELSIFEKYNRVSVTMQLNSVRKFLDLEFEWILPGHGRRVEFKDNREKNSALEAFLATKEEAHA